MRNIRSLLCVASICLVLLLLPAVALLPAACGGEGNDPTSVAASAKVYELRFSHHVPPQAPIASTIEEWTQNVEEATNGQVKFTIYPSESLAKGREALESTKDGVCDVALINLVYVSSQWSLNSVLTLGSLAVPSEGGAEIWDKLLERFPEMAAEMDGVKVLSKSIAMTTSIHVRDREIRVPDDIKGMKLAGLGDSVAVLEAAGATPVNISSGDWAVSAQNGVIVGCMAPIGVVTDRGLQTTFDSHLDLGLGQGGNVVIMNRDVWNSLPTEVQAAFDELTPWLSEAIRTANLKLEAQGWQECAGQTVVKPSGKELPLWMACFEPSAREWIETNAGKGPSQEIYDYLEQLIEQQPE